MQNLCYSKMFFPSQTVTNQQYLGDVDNELPIIPDVDFGALPLPHGVTQQHVHTFTDQYRMHCAVLSDAVHTMQVQCVVVNIMQVQCVVVHIMQVQGTVVHSMEVQCVVVHSAL